MVEPIQPVSWDPQGLVDQLPDPSDHMFVNVTATWMQYAHDLDRPARLTGDPIVDAWVAATVAYLARKRGLPIPQWTAQGKPLKTFFHPGPDWMWAYDIAHSPVDYWIRGILVDPDSLRSV